MSPQIGWMNVSKKLCYDLDKADCTKLKSTPGEFSSGPREIIAMGRGKEDVKR